MSSYALLIGITYPNSSSYLPGCDNDVYDIYKFLKDRGYQNFDILCDSDVFNNVDVNVRNPTANIIIESLFRLTTWAKANPTGKIFLHYSGHGTQVADNQWVFDSQKKNGTEKSMTVEMNV